MEIFVASCSVIKGYKVLREVNNFRVVWQGRLDVKIA